jgi:hypothetical protein
MQGGGLLERDQGMNRHIFCSVKRVLCPDVKKSVVGSACVYTGKAVLLVDLAECPKKKKEARHD